MMSTGHLLFIGFIAGVIVTSVVAIVHFIAAERRIGEAAFNAGMRDERERRRRWDDSVIYPGFLGKRNGDAPGDRNVAAPEVTVAPFVAIGPDGVRVEHRGGAGR